MLRRGVHQDNLAFVGSLAKNNDFGFQLCFAFRFLVGTIGTMKIDIASQAQMGPQMVKNLL